MKPVTAGLFFIAISALFIFGKAKAEIAYPVINEVMVDPICSYDKCEWVELYNPSDLSFNLNNWFLGNKKVGNVTIEPNSYLVVTKNKSEFLKVWPDFHGELYELSFTLANTNGEIILSDSENEYQDEVSWDKAAGADFSWELWGKEDAQWLKSKVVGGTPGAQNSVSDLKSPSQPTILSDNNTVINLGKDFELEWEIQTEAEISLKCANNSDLIDLFVDEIPEQNSYNFSNLTVGDYYCLLTAENELGKTASNIFHFQVIRPNWPKIRISEIMPNPATGEEWIELFNASSSLADLSGWEIADVLGSKKNFIIPENTFLRPNDYLVLTYSLTKITLNNDADQVVIKSPDGEVVYQTGLFKDSPKGLSWAKVNYAWQWTKILTPGYRNLKEKEKPTPINCKNEIKTGEIADYLGCYVVISGKIVKNTGSYLYVNDSSGDARVYIKNIAHSAKPGDIYKFGGVIEKYRGNLRIVVNSNADIEVVKKYIKKTKTAVKSTSKKTSSSKSTSQSQAKPTNNLSAKKVAGDLAANLPPIESIENKNNQSFFQYLKLSLALAIIGLILLIFKTRNIYRTKTIGGNFGDDLT